MTKMCVGEKRVLTIPAHMTNRTFIHVVLKDKLTESTRAEDEPIIYSVELAAMDNQPAQNAATKKK